MIFNQYIGTLAGNGCRSIGAAAVTHDDLKLESFSKGLGELIERSSKDLFFLQCGDDDANLCGQAHDFIHRGSRPDDLWKMRSQKRTNNAPNHIHPEAADMEGSRNSHKFDQ